MDEKRYLVGERGPMQPVYGVKADFPEVSVGLAIPVDRETAEALAKENTAAKLVVWELVPVKQENL